MSLPKHLDRPEQKESSVKPVANPSPHVMPVLSGMRAYAWPYEARWNKRGEGYKWCKPTLSPRAGNRYGKVFRWKPELWEQNKNLFGTFEEAFKAYTELEHVQGIGVIVEAYRVVRIGGKDPVKGYVVFGDIDDCRDPDSGTIESWATEMIRELDTYTEVSPSGKGVRFVGLGEKPADKSFLYPDGRKVEVYGGGRGTRNAITFTGVCVEGFDKPVRNIQSFLNRIFPKMKPPSVKKSKRVADQLPELSLEEARAEGIKRCARKKGVSEEEIVQIVTASRPATDEEILATLRRVHKGTRKFDLLYEGEWKKIPEFKDKSSSEAEQALCLMLASGTGLDPERTDRLFRGSKLYDSTWTGKRRESTLKKALARADRVYWHSGARPIKEPRFGQASKDEPGDEPGPAEAMKKRVVPPDNAEGRKRIMDELAELRLNLAWGYRNEDREHGMAACYVYNYLIEKARYEGVLHKSRKKVLVAVTDLELWTKSGLGSKDQVYKGRKVLEEEGLVVTQQKGQGRVPSVYGLNILKDIPKKIVPYPPGFLGYPGDLGWGLDEEGSYIPLDDFDALERGTVAFEEMRRLDDGWEHGKRKPRKPFRSGLNSMAVHDAKYLLEKKLGRGHPDAGICRSYLRKYKDEEGEEKRELKEYWEPHPPLAFSPPYNEPYVYVPSTTLHPPLSRKARFELVCLSTLNPRQKFLTEQIVHGRHSRYCQKLWIAP